MKPFDIATENPFTLWSIDQQTRAAYARDAQGTPVEPGHPHAVCFCAMGWLNFLNVDTGVQARFDYYLFERTSQSMIGLNDGDRNWKPSDFRQAWEDFIRLESRPS